jgi:uncharacterized protein
MPNPDSKNPQVYSGSIKTVLLSLALLLSIEMAAGQEHPSVAAQANSVFVGAEGKFEANPDTALLQFNISAQEDSSRAAYDRASKAAEQIRQTLRSNGVEIKAAEIGYYSLQPVYDYKNPKRKLVGYRINADVSLKLKDFSKVAPILEQLADADVDNQRVSYILEDMDAAKAKAVEDAFHHAHDSASTVARAGGRGLGELIYASVDTYENPRPVPIMTRAMMAGANAPTPAPTEQFTPQTVSVTAHVNAMFSLK